MVPDAIRAYMDRGGWPRRGRR